MANPWDNDPIVTKPKAEGNPWDNDPVVSKANAAPAAKQKNSVMQDIGHGIGNLAAGAVRGAGSIGATILAPYDMAQDAMAGKGLSLESNRQRRAAMDDGLQSMGAQPDSLMYQGGKLAGEIAGTAGAGGAMANGVLRVAPGAANLANALATSGMRAGAATGNVGMATRVAGGAAAGAASAGMVDPNNALAGAVIGGALPPALAGLGAAGRFVGNKLAAPALTPEVRQAVESARQAGYVMPPTQVKPTMINRTLEGFSGKLTTAQNASAKNQPITNELARKAIGASDLSEAGIAQVRGKANQAYDALAQVGKFQADGAFSSALDNAGATSKAMRENFPELVNSEVDDLVASMKARPEFDAQSTIEAMKQFRADATTNKAALDPAKKALGRAQTKIAGALEDMVERNLEAAGNQPLLASFRDARQTLAKTYDVEKALNKVTGNVDGNKLAGILQKGKPITGDLRTIAEFAARFPKANQTVERMGSLPGFSPLDFAALGTMSAATSNPLLMAGVAARPIARAVTLGPMVQNALSRPPGTNRLLEMLSAPGSQQLMYRTAPFSNALMNNDQQNGNP